MDLDLQNIDSTQTIIEIDQELAKRGLHDFIKIAWSLVEPGKTFLDNWHIQAICEHLEAVIKKEITRLVINVPPGSMKSLTTCVFFPAWAWTQDPSLKWIFASYSTTLSRRDALRTRRLMESRWYRERWGDVWQPNLEEWTAMKFSNTKGGMRLSTSVEGGVTGDHADIQVVDDPIKPQEVTGSLAVSRAALEKVITWWKDTMSSRLIDFHKSARILIMQRLHEGDLAGHMLKEDPDTVHLRLPMEYEPLHKCRTFMFEDPRIDHDQLLWPDRFPAQAVKKLKKDLGSRGTAAQLQQRPSPLKGAIFKADWVQYYTEPPSLVRALLIQSWDCTFKDSKRSTFVCGQVWAQIVLDYYLLAQIRERLGLSGTCRRVEFLTSRYPRAYKKLVEDKANGPAVVETLNDKIPGLELVTPLGGKESRANAVEPIWEAKHVFLPDPSIAPWIVDFVDELLKFPASMFSDQVDSMSQGLIYLQSRSRLKYKLAVANMGDIGALTERRHLRRY